MKLGTLDGSGALREVVAPPGAAYKAGSRQNVTPYQQRPLSKRSGREGSDAGTTQRTAEPLEVDEATHYQYWRLRHGEILR
jgi:hypothetical protein